MLHATPECDADPLMYYWELPFSSVTFKNVSAVVSVLLLLFYLMLHGLIETHFMPPHNGWLSGVALAFYQ